MWPFSKTQKNVGDLPFSNENTKDNIDYDLSDINKAINRDVKDHVEAELKQVFNYDDFQTDSGYGNNGGNFFGVEYDIRASAARLKSVFLREPWVYTTASLISRTLSTVPMNVVDAKTEEVIENHPLNKLVNKGNYLQDNITREWTGNIDLSVGGNYFLVTDENYEMAMYVPIEHVSIKAKDITSLDNFKQALVEGGIDYIDVNYTFEGQKLTNRYPAKQIVHFKLPNPFNPLYGLSMFAAASRPILLDRYKNEFEMAFYLKGATNAGVIESTQDMTKQRLHRLMDTFEQAFTGKRNWWRTIFLPKNSKWISSGLTQAEMQHLEGLRENRLTLLATLGIPPSMVGIVQDVNRATSEVQEANFWQNTILPLVYFKASGWNNSYIVKGFYKGEVKVMPDLTGIAAVEGSIEKKAEVAKGVQDYLVINEIRQDILGYPPLKQTDPRGNKFVREISPAANVFGQAVSENSDDLGPMEEDAIEDREAKKLQQGYTGDGDGEYRHSHLAQWDDVTGDGVTMSTEGNGPSHKHDIIAFKIQASGEDNHTHPPLEITDDITAKELFNKVKAAVTSKQDNIESVQGSKLHQVVMANARTIEDQVIQAIDENRNIRGYLVEKSQERSENYMVLANPILRSSMERGFTMGMLTTKSLSNGLYQIKKNTKAHRFTETDEEAIAVIHDATQATQNNILEQRGIRNFYGFDETMNSSIMQSIEDSLSEGKTLEQVAKDLENQRWFSENYKDQAFTISRTETLTAVSQGINWTTQTLQKIYTEVNKQWFHVGDVASNEDARVEHAEFEKAGKGGVVPASYIYRNPQTGGEMSYPRDPMAGASDLINCRCSLSNVIPDSAVSVAKSILNK
jgi:HK97 family phage portal protein